MHFQPALAMYTLLDMMKLVVASQNIYLGSTEFMSATCICACGR